MFTAAIRQETDVFSDLFENKELSAIPIEIGERHDLVVEKQRAKKIAHQQDDGNRGKIVADAREFRSEFPATLHGAEFHVIQSTLKVRR